MCAIDWKPTIHDELDPGPWYPKGNTSIFEPWTVTDLTDTGLGGRDNSFPSVSFVFDAEVGFVVDVGQNGRARGD
jgi:hypothetical protein